MVTGFMILSQTMSTSEGKSLGTDNPPIWIARACRQMRC